MFFPHELGQMLEQKCQVYQGVAIVADYEFSVQRPDCDIRSALSHVTPAALCASSRSISTLR
jgi:hypothetical protein